MERNGSHQSGGFELGLVQLERRMAAGKLQNDVVDAVDFGSKGDAFVILESGSRQPGPKAGTGEKDAPNLLAAYAVRIGGAGKGALDETGDVLLL